MAAPATPTHLIVVSHGKHIDLRLELRNQRFKIGPLLPAVQLFRGDRVPRVDAQQRCLNVWQGAARTIFIA
jgi:hypothetical protein